MFTAVRDAHTLFTHTLFTPSSSLRQRRGPGRGWGGVSRAWRGVWERRGSGLGGAELSWSELGWAARGWAEASGAELSGAELS